MIGDESELLSSKPLDGIRKIKMREEILDVEEGKVIYLYDDNDVLIKLTDLDDRGKVSLTVDYLNDSSGNNIERVVKNADGALIRRLCFKFDDAGREIEHTEYDNNNELQFIAVREYNQDPGKVKVTAYNSDGEIKAITIEDAI